MNIFKILLTIAILFPISCTQNLLLKKNAVNKYQKIILFATAGKQIRYAHLKTKSESFQVEPGEVIGYGEPFPNPLSKEWDKAIYNISRALILWNKRFPNGLYEQALMFLTEAYFEIGKYDESQYYAYQILNNFSDNQYVQKYLLEMKRECRK